MSRPKKVFTSEEIAQVEALASYGHTQEEITTHLGIKQRTFRYAKNENEVLNASYTRGRFKARNFVVSRLMRFIKNDELTATNLKAIQFYLENSGWGKEANKNDNKVKLSFKAKAPEAIINSSLVALEEGEINLSEANQLANLATTKMNIENNYSVEEKIIHEYRSKEELWERVKIYTMAEQKLMKEKEALEKQKGKRGN